MKKETVYNYFVDEEGNIFNKQGRKKATRLNVHGYEVVFLWKDNKYKNFTVHRLVAKAFIPNSEDKPCVNHIDGNKANNKVENLEWVTYSENTIHALENKLKVPELGEDVHNSTITNDQAHEICKMIQDGFRNKEIGKKLDVSINVVCNIRLGRGWTHISKDYKLIEKSSTLAEETVKWVCKQIEAGLTNTQIIKIATNERVTVSFISKIRNKKTYTHISSQYSF